MRERVKVTLRSPHRVQRISHFLLGALFFRLPASVRQQLFAGQAHYCPICQSRLSRFLVLHRPYHLWCPVCRSLQRHRLVWRFLMQEEGLHDGPTRLLHIAPEPALEATFAAIEGVQSVTADLFARDVDTRLDVETLPFDEGTFDLIYCSHVLEHVPDDRQALREFWRVLKPGGRAILLVPITVERTVEDVGLSDPVERERRFGQHDHVRSYGLDFMDRVREAGFTCTLFTPSDIVAPVDVAYLGLDLSDKIFLCEATG